MGKQGGGVMVVGRRGNGTTGDVMKWSEGTMGDMVKWGRGAGEQRLM